VDLESADLGLGLAAGCYENGSESSGSIEGGESYATSLYEGVSKSFRTGGLERELQMVQLSVTRCSCIASL
jgi:hypothetical protein